MKSVMKWELVETSEGYALVESVEQVADKNILADLQRLVGGRIEVVTYINGAALLMNEEAHINGMQAWAVKEEHFLHKIVPDHFILKGHKILVGPVVLCKDDGESFYGFTEDELTLLLS
ncbi:DUF3846 domain-containing protein [Vibrio fortis]|uniref:DUF3846 domain-containing protein n=1 Tax=Vibrio fortis TaxID=212667 RepID=UPI0038CD6822